MTGCFFVVQYSYSHLSYRLLFCQFVFDFPLFVFLGPSHLCVPDIGRFLVACWLKSWTATTYIFLCDPYTYTCVRQHARKSKWKHSPRRMINCGDSPLRWSGPPFLLGLDGKERKKAGLPAPGDGQFYPPVVGYHHPPASLTCRIHSSYQSIRHDWRILKGGDFGLCPPCTRVTPILGLYPCWWVGFWRFGICTHHKPHTYSPDRPVWWPHHLWTVQFERHNMWSTKPIISLSKRSSCNQ